MSYNEARAKAQARYDKKNTIRITLKLNKKTDTDIIAAIGEKNKQGRIKELIRKALSK